MQIHLSDLKKGQVWGTNYGRLQLDKTREITWIGPDRLRYRMLYSNGKRGSAREVKITTFRAWLYDHGVCMHLVSAA